MHLISGTARCGARNRSRRVNAIVATTALVASCLLVACGRSSELPEPGMSPSAPEEGSAVFTLSSPAFETGGLIPSEYANTGHPGGENVSIPYEWAGAPEGTESLALLLVDRAPIARSWVHWLVTSIPGDATGLARGASGTTSMPGGAVEHVNSFGSTGYGGPQPPGGTGKHEYEAVVYALDTDALDLAQKTTLAEFTRAIDGHVLAQATHSGMLGR